MRTGQPKSALSTDSGVSEELQGPYTAPILIKGTYMEEFIKCFTAADGLVEAPPQPRRLAPYRDWHGIVNALMFNHLEQIYVTRRAMREGDVDSGKWQPVIGGGVMPGESFEQAVIREIRQEICCRVNMEDLSLLGCCAADKPGQSMRVVRIFAVMCDDKTPVRPNLRTGEIIEGKWMQIFQYDQMVKTSPEMWCAKLHAEDRPAIRAWLYQKRRRR
jgi:ADP-ribose pyrophosphatase YjhB (NUDIX family)